MFKTEKSVTAYLADLVYHLRNVTDELHDVVDDVLVNVDTINVRDNDEAIGTFDVENLDYIFADMVSSERAAAKDLKRFDRLLTLIIAERRKLGDFNLTN
jgi:hypothetical protein